MENQKWDDILARTLDDLRLSRGEKTALRQVLADDLPSAEELAFCRNRAFAHAKTVIAEGQARETLDWLEDVVGLLFASLAESADTDAEAFFSEEHDCPHTIASLIQRTKKSLDVCVFTITDDRISEPILDAHRRGLAVRVITDDDKASDPGSDIASFRRAGVAVRTDDSAAHMHHKFALFDNRRVLAGSYNWTRSAARGNQENFVVTGNGRLVKAFARRFEILWTKFA